MHFYFYSKGLIFTRRIQQLFGVGVLIAMAALAIRAFDQMFVVQTMETVFVIAFIFTYFREERRAMHEPQTKVMKQWDLFEDVLFAATVLGYLIFAWIHRYTFHMFYGYFNVGGVGLYLGIIFGEWLWHNSRLKHLDDVNRQRYWKNYKDNLMG